MSTLNCKEFDELLCESAAADDEPLLAHARSCTRCADVLSEERTLAVAVRAWNDAVPSADLSDRVVARWRVESVEHVPSRRSSAPPVKRLSRGARSHPLLLGAVAAAMLVAAVSLLFSPRSNPAGNTVAGPNRKPANVVDASQDAADPDRNATRDSAREDALEVEQLVDDFRKQYANVTRNVTQKMAALKLPQLDGAGMWPNFNRDPTVAPSPKRESNGNWGARLKPVERDVRKAFGFLRDAVPILNDSST